MQNNNAFSDNEFPIIGFGTIGGGISYENKIAFDFTANLFNIGFNFDGFGIEGGLFNYQYSNNYNGHLISFINPRIYFPVYTKEIYSDGHHNSDYFFIEIFSSINLLNWYNFNEFRASDVIFTLGITLVNIKYIMFVTTEAMAMEMGYKNNNGIHSIFLTIKIDPFFWGIIFANRISEYNEK
jgi:hypothetical protein